MFLLFCPIPVLEGDKHYCTVFKFSFNKVFLCRHVQRKLFLVEEAFRVSGRYIEASHFPASQFVIEGKRGKSLLTASIYFLEAMLHSL